MTAMAVDRWRQAQDAERDYWYPADPGAFALRRAEEHERQRWYAGLLRIEFPLGASVIELGAGPAGLLTRSAESHIPRVVAVEPMALDASDVAAYERRDIELVPCRVEDYQGDPADEVWLVNVLQHVEAPSLVLDATRRLAQRTVRVFEWVHEPTSTVHLHTVTPVAILGAFHAWHLVFSTEGRARTPGWSQQFVAYVFERRWPE